MSLNRLVYIIERVSALTGAGDRYRPDALTSGSALFALRAPGDVAVYDNNAYGLFGRIFQFPNQMRQAKLNQDIAPVPELPALYALILWTKRRIS